MAYLAPHRKTAADPLLWTTDGRAPRVLAISGLRALFTEVLRLTGLSAAGYTLHSHRRGGASFAYYAGVPISAIKHHGTWTSDAVYVYLLSLPAQQSPVAQAFAALLPRLQRP